MKFLISGYRIKLSLERKVGKFSNSNFSRGKDDISVEEMSTDNHTFLIRGRQVQMDRGGGKCAGQRNNFKMTFLMSAFFLIGEPEVIVDETSHTRHHYGSRPVVANGQ